MQAENAVRNFRRTTRRLAAQYIAGKIDRNDYLSAVRKAALAAELIVTSDRRRNRADTILDALAWSHNALAPGELPAALEPYFDQFQNETMDLGTLRARVTDSIARASQPPGFSA